MKFFMVMKFFMALLVMPALCPLNAGAQEVAGASRVLMESSTGQIIFAENPHERMPIASVTKTMVLLLLAEEMDKGRLSFSDKVAASDYASGTEGSVIWLEPGEIMTAGELIKSVVISSANDAAIALAEHVAGSEKEFVRRMNKKAAELGLENTNFTGCVGFDDEKHYSSAYDVARIAAALFEYNSFEEFYKIRLSAVRQGTPRETQLLNTNKLIGYKGLLGGKTGTTEKAGYCLAVCAEQDGMRLISVLLGAKNDEERVAGCKELLDLGFEGYERYTAVIENLPVLTVPDGVVREIALKLREPVNCIIPKNAHKSIKYSVNTPEEWSAPLAEGEKVGEITGTIDGNVIFKNDIVAAGGSEKLTFLIALRINILSFFSN